MLSLLLLYTCHAAYALQQLGDVRLQLAVELDALLRLGQEILVDIVGGDETGNHSFSPGRKNNKDYTQPSTTPHVYIATRPTRFCRDLADSNVRTHTWDRNH